MKEQQLHLILKNIHLFRQLIEMLYRQQYYMELFQHHHLIHLVHPDKFLLNPDLLRRLRHHHPSLPFHFLHRPSKTSPARHGSR